MILGDEEEIVEREKIADSLGWFSIGLGLGEVTAARRVGRFLGIEHRAGLLRAYGVREIATGIGILTLRRRAPGLWARVGGDALDLATLGSALLHGNPKRGNVGAAIGAVAAITALDVVAAQRLGSQPTSGAATGAIEIKRTISIGKSAEGLYRVWREPQALPTLMKGFAEITPLDADRARWKLRAPLGRTLEWETQIVEDRPSELVRWESLPGASLPHQGSISFRPAPDGWGTEATLCFHFEPPPGPLGGVAALLPDAVPAIAVGTVLRRFKSLAETGEIPTLEHNPSARGRGDTV